MKTNRSTFAIFFYPNTSKTKKSGACPIVGRITVDGKNTTFSTGLEITPDGWDGETGAAKGKSQESISVNKQIERFRNEISTYYKDMVTNNGYVTAEALKKCVAWYWGTSQYLDARICGTVRGETEKYWCTYN